MISGYLGDIIWRTKHISIESKVRFYKTSKVRTYDIETKEEAAVKTQTYRATMISGYLRDIIWRTKHIRIESKVKFYKTSKVRTYNIDTKEEAAVTKKLLRTTKSKTLISIAGYTLRDQKRKELIREQCNIQNIVRWSRQRRREWRDHVNRIDNEKLAKIAMS